MTEDNNQEDILTRILQGIPTYGWILIFSVFWLPALDYSITSYIVCLVIVYTITTLLGVKLSYEKTE
jgi:hypothetical protein